MPAKNKRLVTFHLSIGEKRAFDFLAGGNRSVYIRRLIAQDAERRGVDWPDETSDTRGQYPRHQCPQCDGWNVGRAEDGTKACADCGWIEGD